MKERLKPRPELLQSELRAAIALCCRPGGATAHDLSDVMHARRVQDAPQRLRKYLSKYSDLTLFTYRMDADRRARECYIGPGKIYRVRYKEEKFREEVIAVADRSRLDSIQRMENVPQVTHHEPTGIAR